MPEHNGIMSQGSLLLGFLTVRLISKWFALPETHEINIKAANTKGAYQKANCTFVINFFIA